MTTLEFLILRANEKGAKKPGRGLPIEIPDAGRDDLAHWFAELGFREGAEIGVKAGVYSEILCKANPELHLYSIDPWLVREEYFDRRGQRLFDKYEAQARERLARYNCTILKAKSCDAVKQFKRRSLDFVYIDGHHNLFNVIHDLHFWSMIVRPGGIIAGHDWTRFQNQAMHVVQGTIAYTDAYKIRPWFVLGTKAAPPGTVRDRHRTFLWVRPDRQPNMHDYDPTQGGQTEVPA